MSLKLGKKPFVPSPKDFKASKYLDLATLPTAPSKFGFGKMFPDGELSPNWAMLANGPDSSVSKNFQGAGCCVFSSASHQTRIFNKDRGGVDVPFDGKAVLSDYSAVTGYVIGDDATDTGTVIRDALNYRRRTGVVDSNGNRHKIAGFVSFDAKNWDHLMRGVYTFGAIEIGFAVPDTIWAQLDAGVPWDVTDPNAQIIGGHDICLHEDTKIPLLDGRDVAIGELAATGENPWIYAIGVDGKVRPAPATNIRQTGSNRSLIRVHLDSGEWFDCTDDHLIMRRDGSYCPAGQLRAEDSLMPLYRRSSNGSYHGMKGYEEILDPGTQEWIFTHWRVTDCAIGKRWGVVHHKDRNKRNNSPDNLERMSWSDHRFLHANDRDLLEGYAKSDRGRAKSREMMLELWKSSERREKNAEHLKTNPKILKHRKSGIANNREAARANGKKTGPINIAFANMPEAQKKRVSTWKYRFETDPEFRTAVQERARINIGKFNNKNNHKVVFIERIGNGDVYDLEVRGYHNFALSSGVFVHNCVVGSMLSSARGTAITWGQRQEFTKNFFELYNDECWGIVTQEMIRPDGLGLHGFDLATFNADLAAL